MIVHSRSLYIRAFVLVAFTLFGCTTNTEAPPTTQAAATTNPAAGNLTIGLESLRKLAEGSDHQAAQRTIFYLNQWISADPASAAAWQPDRMLESLPRALRNTPGLERLPKLQFSFDDSDLLRNVQWLDDISYLQQNLWLHDISQRARRQPAGAPWRAWLKKIEKEVGLPEAEQLATAERMLDWTTRNIQLDTLPPQPKDPLATAGTTETVLPSFRGEVGPGYGHLPLETLLYGRGDAHERARIFILLCRQAGIDAVMLGFSVDQSVARRGWLPAVLIGGKLYLFDSSLGLPLAGPEGQGIATLDQVIKEPALLKQADVPGVAAYPITEKDLKLGVLALIDAEPAALSRRMQMLQAAMPAATRLALSTKPSELEPKLRKANVSGVSLWTVPFEAIGYRIGHQVAASQNQQAAQDLHRQGILFSPARPLIKGRNLHLQGRYENEERKSGAHSLYLQCRPPDREIDAMKTSEFYRKSIGLDQNLPNDPAQREATLNLFTQIAREGKFYATYWLGLSYYDAGRYDAAIEWLGERTVQVSPPSPFTPGARYNLARCYEELGKPDLAKQWLESDKESPQRAGNLLRAKLLETKGAGSKAKASE